MPRQGPRRPLLAVKVAQEDIDALDLLAEKAGVNRSDVVRLGLETVLRGMPEHDILDFLAASRDAGEPPTRDPRWQTALETGIAAVREVNERTAEQIRQQKD